MNRLEYMLDEGVQQALDIDRGVSMHAAARMVRALDPEARRLLERVLDWYADELAARPAQAVPAALAPTYRPAVDDRGS